jgi:hypothetical protein
MYLRLRRCRLRDNVEVADGGSRFDAVALQRDGSRRTIEGIRLPMPGRHNVLNALAAIAVGMELGMDDATIALGFEKFDGVKRRFSRVGEVDGAIVIDDYAHHPVEIRAVLSAARESAEGRVIAVVQPHRYTRLQALMEDFQAAFNDADIVMVAPVYPAGGEPIEGVDSAALAEGLRAHGHRMVKLVDSPGSRGEPARHCRGRRHRPLPRGRRHHEVGGRPCRRHRQGAASQEMSTVALQPAVKGKLKADAPLAPLVWFKSGGKADWLFEPADEADLVSFLKQLDSDLPVMALGLGSNMIVRDGGVPGVVVRLGKVFSKIENDQVTCGAAAVRVESSSPRPRAMPASPASNSCAVSRARLEGSSA